MTVSSCKIKVPNSQENTLIMSPLCTPTKEIIGFIWRLPKRILFQSLEVELVLLVRRRSVIIALKGREVTIQ